MTYLCKDGRQVTICVDDEMDYMTTVNDNAGKEIGRIEFTYIQEDQDDYLKLTWAYLDRLDSTYRFQGIGRECLKLVKELSGLPIVAEDNDGISRSDGSHLTGDAAGFVNRMRVERIIAASAGKSIGDEAD